MALAPSISTAARNAACDAVVDEYRGHICVSTEPGCTCATHATALREVKRLTAERDAALADAAALRAVGQEMHDAMRAYGDGRSPASRDRVVDALKAWRALAADVAAQQS